MVKSILRERRVNVPEDVTVAVKSKVVTVEGVKGILSRSFKGVPIQIQAEKNEDGKVVSILVRIWFAKSK